MTEHGEPTRQSPPDARQHWDLAEQPGLSAWPSCPPGLNHSVSQSPGERAAHSRGSHTHWSHQDTYFPIKLVPTGLPDVCTLAAQKPPGKHWNGLLAARCGAHLEWIFLRGAPREAEQTWHHSLS